MWKAFSPAFLGLRMGLAVPLNPAVGCTLLLSPKPMTTPSGIWLREGDGREASDASEDLAL